MRLGDNFPRKLLHVKKSALGVGLIEPATVIDYLAIKLYVGNKRAKGELTSVINIHEEISQEDSGLPRRARRQQGTIKYWKAGWIEEIDEKLRERKIEIVDEEEKDLVTTTNKFLMEYAIEYVNEKKDKMKVLKKINSVRKYKGVMLPYELFGEKGNQLTTCGRITEERSSLVWKRVAIASKKPAKGSRKAWEDFTLWLRAQNVKTTKDFKAECEWKWLINNHSERLYVKDDNAMHKVYVKVSDNNGQNKYEYEKEEEEIEVQCEGVIGVFVNNKLRIIDTNSDFQEIPQEDLEIIVFSEDIKQAIAENEAIAATDASVKDGIMAGVWKIQAFYECASNGNSMWSRNWRKNTALAAEAAIVLDLVAAVEHNMRGYDDGKIQIHTDCKKLW